MGADASPYPFRFMNLLQWERAVAVATMTARERLAPVGGSALMRASGRHPGGRVAGGEGLLAGLIHEVRLVLSRPEERRVGKASVSPVQVRMSPLHYKKKNER